MKTISLCMIVKNEEEVLDNCLSSISDVVDEIIIVDTGSNDNTKIIANKYTNNIYDFKWCDDFSKARNYSFSKATKDYILWLDADDYLTLENKEKLANLIATTLEQIRVANILLHPIAPKGTENVADYLGFKDGWNNWDYIFENVYTLFPDKNNHKLKTLKEKEDFFKKHPTQLEM